jgi:hypothetical protein
LLSAEWTMLNDPERLRQFSDTYLNLRSINPAQFTSVTDLDGKLPAPVAEMPPPSTDEEPVSVDSVPQSVPEPAIAVPEKDALPVPPVPAAHPPQVVATAPHPPETKPAVARPVGADAPARQVAVAEPRSSDQRPSDQRQGDQRSPERRGAARVVETYPGIQPSGAPAPRPIVLAAPRPALTSPSVYAQPAPSRPATTPAVPAPYTGTPYAGSLLGMARGSMPAAPRPTPVNATYNAN